MADKSVILRRSCPYLGLRLDQASIFIQPAEEHRCYAAGKVQPVKLPHQSEFCLTPNFKTCPRFVAPIPAADKLAEAIIEPPVVHRKISRLNRYPVWQVIAGLVTILLIAGFTYGYRNSRWQNLLTIITPPTPVSSTLTAYRSPLPTPSPQPIVTPGPSVDDAPVADFTPMPPLPTAELPPGQLQIDIYPAGNAIGWLSSNDPLNHFGDRNMHVGFYEDNIYYGAMQFNMGSILPGAKIEQATLAIMGLSSENLGDSGTWRLQLLEPDLDDVWSTATYRQIHDAAISDTISPAIQAHDLTMRQANLFEFSPAQLAKLEQRLFTGLVSFRLDGPSRGPDNLFTWDTGYGGGFGNRPVLRVVYQPPPTPTPIVVAVTSPTPTPANPVTAAALAATATFEATATGTATPLPANIVTATPPVIVTHTPMPGNAATAAWLEDIATAEAFLHGTPTPLPTDFWTATPTPTYIIVTSTPTPENILTMVPAAVQATQIAATIGTFTPVPNNWVTPIIVTATPIPANAATADYQQTLATAQAMAYGPEATPANIWTVTPTPALIFLHGQLPTSQPTSTATPTPVAIPAQLLGKIIFLSDRAQLEEPLLFAVDPDGNNLALLSSRWPYDQACERDTYSADTRFRVFTKDTPRYQNVTINGEDVGIREDIPTIFWYDAYYNTEEQLTNFGTGIAYGGVWSPTTEQIAFVSNDSGDDEIWAVNRDGGDLRQLTAGNTDYNAREIGKDTFIPEVNKHPSWSPDGSKIIFWSNRTGHRQIWIMNADGSNPYSISRTGFNDWNPVWVKYIDPPPPLPE